jgi:hypothetical protein
LAGAQRLSSGQTDLLRRDAPWLAHHDRTGVDPSRSGVRRRGTIRARSGDLSVPGTSEEGYGLFTGGKALDGEPAYVAFLLRRDGSASIQSRTGGGTTPVRPWTRHEAIKTGDAKDPVANILRVVAETTEVGFDVNGQRVLSVPRAEVMVDGGFGFRAGPTSTCTSAGST